MVLLHIPPVHQTLLLTGSSNSAAAARFVLMPDGPSNDAWLVGMGICDSTSSFLLFHDEEKYEISLETLGVNLQNMLIKAGQRFNVNPDNKVNNTQKKFLST
ncbi:hypothetical protein CEXT_365271 [Caerostris extrusa]|uniref:Uncharacterized protein n=1 Tax=Caerostris extrusa TaxID=172846 RepID=A0AAV4QB93_CAEEX|nr:hypothetical protein CEXT_365271 [Caerostris extrusa]